MEEQIKNVIEFLKQQNVRGCITGSCFLGFFPDEKNIQDVDVFLYDEKAFTELYYALYHNKLFTILDKLEQWKSDSFRQKESFNNGKHVSGVTTIKFMYNTIIPVNIIYKKSCNNIFSTLASFDMDIISYGYDLQSKQYLDLSGESRTTKVASWNKWNPAFNSTDVWNLSRILRQTERLVKYWKRGINTDPVCLKYIEMINALQEFQSIFSSENFNERLKITQENTLIVKQICELWLKTHEITDAQLEVLQQKIKEI